MILVVLVLVYLALTKKFYRYDERGIQHDDNYFPVDYQYTVGKWHVSRAVGTYRNNSEFGLAYRPIVALFNKDGILMIESAITTTSSILVMMRPVFPFIKFRLMKGIGI